MSRIAIVLALGLGGCATSLGPVGVMRRSADDLAVKLIRPGVTGRACRVSVMGVRLSGNGPALSDALERITALDDEGDVVVNGEVRVEQFVTGVYDRRCVEVRGDLARTIRTVILPAPPEHHGH